MVVVGVLRVYWSLVTGPCFTHGCIHILLLSSSSTLPGSLLYFCIASLATIEPTYQYSLEWFADLFVRGCQEAEPSKDLSERYGAD